MTRVQRPNETDIAGIVALNNSFAPQGLTLPRTPDFVYAHLADYRVIRDADGGIVACAGLDEYSPSIAEIISLAVSEDEQGLGHGKSLIAATERLARARGYDEVFSVSYSDDLFLACGFEHAPLTAYPEKISRYEKIDRGELTVGEKHCFRKRLRP
ncbi:MAG TPA: GNAT family N-acetyltransferase [Gemmatimonadaceae bacterium]|nr:GNAT family N-acetyltransferase [Gemmatimonadaceae bacterium]